MASDNPALFGRLHPAKRVKDILRTLQNHILARDIGLNEATLNTPYRNTIPPAEEPLYPGNIELEENIEKLICQRPARRRRHVVGQPRLRLGPTFMSRIDLHPPTWRRRRVETTPTAVLSAASDENDTNPRPDLLIAVPRPTPRSLRFNRARRQLVYRSLEHKQGTTMKSRVSL